MIDRENIGDLALSIPVKTCPFDLKLYVIVRDRSESLFYYFRIEDHIPKDHLLRLIDQHIDFAFVRETLKASYSHTGRPSIDPEVLLHTQHEFTHVPEENAYRCPGGHLLRYIGISRGAQGFTYGAKPSQ
jgi:hypothetical protein